MRCLLYDRYNAHGLPLEGWGEKFLRVDSMARTPLTAAFLRKFDVAIIHVTDDPTNETATAACAAGCRVLLFTGDRSDEAPRRHERALLDRFPDSDVLVVPLHLLRERFPLAMKWDNAELFTEDRVGRVIELLTTLWSLGVLWERDGIVFVAREGTAWILHQTRGDETNERVPLVEHGVLNLNLVAGIRSSSGRTLAELAKPIYTSADRPELRFDRVMASVTNPAAYQSALTQLRDVWLAWARGENGLASGRD